MTRVVTAAPCANCPFRKDVPIYLRSGRREEIARGLIDGHTFHCHATVDYDDEGDGHETSESVQCAGAAKALMLSGGTTQMMRIGERLGLVDLDKVAERGAEVWSLADWVRLAERSTGDDPVFTDDEVNPCGTVDEGCLAPAGYMGSGGAVISGTESADGECPECGEPVCSNCADAYGHCGTCHSYHQDEDDDGR